MLHPCKQTIITSTQTISDIVYIETNVASTGTFVAFQDSVATAYSLPALCALTYSIGDATDATTYGVTKSGFTISVLTSNVSLIGTSKGLWVSATATPAQDTPSQTVPFNVIIQSPCPTSTLTLPSAIANTSIVAQSGVGTQVTFAPATNNKETTLGSPGLCGPRVYTIVQVQPATFVTVAPAPANPLTDNWTLNCSSSFAGDVGTWTVTLKAELQDNPTATPATKSFTVTVTHICQSATI